MYIVYGFLRLVLFSIMGVRFLNKRERYDWQKFNPSIWRRDLEPHNTDLTDAVCVTKKWATASWRFIHPTQALFVNFISSACLLVHLLCDVQLTKKLSYSAGFGKC